jgi:hypothetical protein
MKYSITCLQFPPLRPNQLFNLNKDMDELIHKINFKKFSLFHAIVKTHSHTGHTMLFFFLDFINFC